jgi:hypothetical protein
MVHGIYHITIKMHLILTYLVKSVMKLGNMMVEKNLSGQYENFYVFGTYTSRTMQIKNDTDVL